MIVVYSVEWKLVLPHVCEAFLVRENIFDGVNVFGITLRAINKRPNALHVVRLRLHAQVRVGLEAH